MNEKRIMVVDDNLDNILSAYVASSRVNVRMDAAFDLESARKLLSENQYEGVITDMCFQERGINFEENYMHKDLTGWKVIQDWHSRKISERDESWFNPVKPDINKLNRAGRICKNPEEEYQKRLEEYEKNISLFNALKNIPSEIETSFVKAILRSNYIPDKAERVGFTNDELRKKVALESINARNMLDNYKIEGKEEYTLSSIGKILQYTDARTISKRNSVDSGMRLNCSNPALGYFIAKEAKERNIPTSIITSLGHADYALFGAVATEIVNISDLVEKCEEASKYNSSENKDIILYNVAFVNKKTPSIYENLINKL